VGADTSATANRLVQRDGSGDINSRNVTLTGGLKDSSNVRMFMPGGGSFVTTTGTVNGAIRIKLPTQGSGMMMTCTVKVYEYSSNKSFTITFGGHRDSNNWYNEFCYIDGGPNQGNLTVRFGVSGGKDCVWIGETNSSWSYPQVFVTDFQLGFVGYNASWATGWEVAFVTSFDTINRTQTAYAKITNANIASQSVSYADESGYSGSTGSVEWTNVNSRPTALSQFTNDLGNYGGFLTSLGFSYSTGVSANHVVQRDANGYIYANHINFSTPETENPAISSFITSNGDGWSRKSSLAHVRNQLGNYGTWITKDDRAYPRRADGDDINFYWDGQGGQPTWLWGSNNGTDFYVWNPSNFSVNYAASAGNADTVDSLHASVFVRNDIYNSAGAGLEVVRNIGTIDGSWPSDSHTLGLENSDAGNIVINFHRAGYTSHNLWYNGSQFRFDQVVTSTADMRAPIFYDSNDTTYYLDPNGTSNLSRVLIPNASSGASLIVGINNTSRVIDDNSRKGLVVNADYYPHIYVNALSGASNDVHGAVISMTGVLSAGGYRRWGMGIANTDPSALSWGWWDNESNPHYSVGGTLGYTSTGSRMWLDTGGNLQTTGSMRAPIFYDSNDTTYYVDPNSGSVLNRLQVSRGGSYGGYNDADLIVGTGAADRRGFGATGGSSIMLRSLAKSTITALDEGNNLGQISYENLVWTIGEDIGWGVQRVDFPGTVNILGTLRLPNSGLISVNDEPDTWGARFRTTTSTTNLGAQLKNIIWTGGGASEGFAVSGVGYSAALEVNNNGTVWARESFRAPIFYDSNDTNYYVDPASGSNLYGGNGSFVIQGTWPQLRIAQNDGTPDASINYDPGSEYRKWNVGPGAGEAEGNEFGFAIYEGTRGTLYSTPLRINALTGYVQIGDRDNPAYQLDVSGYGYFRDNIGIATTPRSDGYKISMGGSIHLNGNSVDYLGSLYLEGSGTGGHLQPNAGSYGSLQITGSKNSWGGLRFTHSNVTLMMNSNESGHHNDSYGWQFRWENGTLYCHKNSYGGGTSATVLDSSNWTSYITVPASLVTGNTSSASINTSKFNIYNDNFTEAPVILQMNGREVIVYDRMNYVTTFKGEATSSYQMQITEGGINFTADFGGWAPITCEFVSQVSDINLKHYVSTIQSPIEKVKQLRGVDFLWKKNNQPSIGFIAQEVEEVLPVAVGNVDGTKTVDYSKIIPVLTEAIKEQQTIIEQLMARIEALENK
jgi:hypothetical protein